MKRHLLANSVIGIGALLSAAATASSHQLIVLFDEDPANAHAVRAEQAVTSINARGKASEVLRSRLRHPTAARFLIEDQRLTFEERSRRSLDDAESRLHRYVVLEYDGARKQAAALVDVEADPAVVLAFEDGGLETFAVPQDPLYPILPGFPPPWYNFQWGLHDWGMSPSLGMKFPQAWDVTRGRAFVAPVDFGIDTDHPDLLWTYRPHLSYNVPSNNAQVDENYLSPANKGHGTHVAGIIAAGGNYGSVPAGYPLHPVQGVAGVCWWCSTMVVKNSNTTALLLESHVGSGIYWAARRGAQVISLSFGLPRTDANYASTTCASGYSPAICDALEYAEDVGVVVVAAAGNNRLPHVAFPASEPTVVPVAGVSPYYSAVQAWISGTTGSNRGPELAARGVAAPASEVLSTFYVGATWNSSCADSLSAHSGYGPCTGTSMSAPFVAGIAALMRSVDPIASAATVRARLRGAGHLAAAPDEELGHGLVSATAAVQAMSSAIPNRLTPLFAMRSHYQANYFYTTVPQQARSAYMGQLLPIVSGMTVPAFYNYTFVGNTVKPHGSVHTIATGFGSTVTTRAQAWIFSNHVNPKTPATELLPLYRLSYKCGDPIPSGRANACASSSHHVDHFYTTSQAELASYAPGHGYTLDGIEGYVYPATGPQHAGSTPLLRAYRPASDEHAVFPQSEQATMASQGYTDNVTTLGYAYANPASGTRPSL